MKRIYEYEDLQTLIVRSSVYVYRKRTEDDNKRRNTGIAA